MDQNSTIIAVVELSQSSWLGPSGSHKTAIAKRLEKAHDFTRIHAGRPVKNAVRAFGLTKTQTDGDLRDTPTMRLGGAAPRNIMEA